MAYEVKQGNIFGRLGTGFGKGLAEQLPKEIEHQRLSQGLKSLEKDADKLTPLQIFTRGSSIYGASPQMVQSFGELAKQQSMGKTLMDLDNRKNQDQMRQQDAFKTTNEKSSQEGLSPSLTTRDPIDATLNPYIPKTMPEINERAGQLFKENPGLYKGDPQLAINAAIQEDQQNQAINTHLQAQRKSQQDVQSNVESGLKKQQKSLGADAIPGDVFSNIEDKAINAVKPISQGGEGLTEQESKKKYGKELQDVHRKYSALNSVGNWSVLGRSAEENKRSLKSIRDDFKERGDLENFADTLVAKNNISPSKSRYIAYPVSEIKPLNNAIVKLPKLEKKLNFEKGYASYDVPKEYIKDKTLDIAKTLAPLLGKEGSPLSVAEELNERNYDPDVWLDYLNKNRKSLNLTETQGRELDKPRNFNGTMNDWWLFYFSGLDKLVEQE